MGSFARRFATFMVISAAISGLGACATYREQLVRSQHAFEANDHDRALALLENLEPDVSSLQPPEQAEYAYLRGMTDYRIGYRADARHWLAIAKAYEDASPGTLPNDWKARITTALEELNAVVYDEGLVALGQQARPGEDDTSGRRGPVAPGPASASTSTIAAPAPSSAPGP